MDTPKSTQELATQIEALIAGYVDEGRQAAQRAVERAFCATASPPTKPSKKATRTPGKRRSQQQLAELADALCSLVHEQPGESMIVFAAALGVSVRELQRPMTALKRAGRVRTVGQRNWTRYFPAVNGKAGRARA
ncbi:winged helix-turn-helix domain-containing protein [Pseudenhygromyxa sp. WMMC2535]|uniref:winged helix-turn-helix domain-containing protein n=1 Tax=Pseudenhygromyxa sp. WMMC2535 TaxID=2712867 RepID=UPI001556AE4A|nr:winged helix-turn-helix domain-containing protein [Pseudenhygromyxa sp. WMMC2535]NVB41938.1 winged helix-turn-helix domain-containing protein [Pseudenhygromyxa sp. WMMC2535]